MEKIKATRLPNKEMVLNSLQDEKELKGFKKYILFVEFNKKSKFLGVVKADLLLNKEKKKKRFLNSCWIKVLCAGFA